MIGLFDSGIGGLTVVRELLRVAPTAPFVYLGDTARTPYGNKSFEAVSRYSLENAAFLIDKGAQIIVIACNSASAIAAEALRTAYPDIPIFEVITPAVEDAVSVTHGRVGVIGTRATIASGAYEKFLKEKGVGEVVSCACPLFVPLVEEGWLEDGETKRVARRYLSSLRQAQVETLIMGCTHYPLLESIIKRYMGNRVTLINSGVSVVSRLLPHLQSMPLDGRQSYYLTDLSTRSEEIARQWLGRSIQFERADLFCYP